MINQGYVFLERYSRGYEVVETPGRRGRRGGDPRDVFYVEITSAMERPGCPLCNIVEKTERSLIFGILYEHVNDPSTRRKIRESLGLCNHHAWLLYRYSLTDPLIGGLGPAVIYRDMLDTYRRMLEKGVAVDPVKASRKCFLCREVAEYNRIFVEKLAEKIVEADALQKYEANSTSILCTHHYRDVMRVIARKGGKSEAEKLRQVQESKVRHLLSTIKGFIDKFDYRAKKGHTTGEAVSTELAIRVLKGSPTTAHIYGDGCLRE